MRAQNFPGELRRMSRQLEQYALHVFPAMAGRKTLRFINGNFRAQGWQGASFRRWQPNRKQSTILIRKGHLRRSFRQRIAPGEVTTFTDDPKAAVHNRGFKGTVSVKSFERRRFSAQRVGTGRFTKTGKERKKTIHVESGRTIVKAHARKMNMPQRQFMPERYNDSPVLINSIRKDVVKTLKTIFKT